MPTSAADNLELTIVLPCLNEAETLAVCIRKARTFFSLNKIRGEVVVADNGSKDGSQKIAKQEGARVIDVRVRGYGAALMGGIEAAIGKFIIMADADDSYDLENLMPFLERLRQGYELVMGNRFTGGIKPGAMPMLHRYLGNPVLTGLGRLLYNVAVGDFHCGIRGFSKAVIQSLELKTTGMEFASEMVVVAALKKIRITEVPTTLSPDGRSRSPHLRSWRDGWRHLRFLLIYSPRWLFLYPGLFMLAMGLLGMCVLLPAPRTVGSITFDIHSMLYTMIGILTGLQLLVFALFSKLIAKSMGLISEDKLTIKIQKMMTLEWGLIVGGVLVLAGLSGSVYSLLVWGQQSFGPLISSRMMRLVIPSVTCFAAGIQICFMSFFMGVLQIKHK